MSNSYSSTPTSFPRLETVCRSFYFEKDRTCVLQDRSGAPRFARFQTDGNNSLSVTDEARLAWQNLPYQVDHNPLVVSASDGRQLLRKEGNVLPLTEAP